MGVLDNAYKQDYQLSHQWDLVFTDPKATSLGLKFRVSDCSIPFRNLRAERKNTGELIYTEVAEFEEMSFTIREDSSFTTYKYFEDWLNTVYDFDKRMFNAPTTDNNFYRDCEVVFYKPLVSALEYPLAGADLNVYTISQIYKEKISQSFTFKNCRILGLSELSLDYSGSDCLKYSVTIIPESDK